MYVQNCGGQDSTAVEPIEKEGAEDDNGENIEVCTIWILFKFPNIVELSMSSFIRCFDKMRTIYLCFDDDNVVLNPENFGLKIFTGFFWEYRSTGKKKTVEKRHQIDEIRRIWRGFRRFWSCWTINEEVEIKFPEGNRYCQFF